MEIRAPLPGERGMVRLLYIILRYIRGSVLKDLLLELF